MPFFARRHRAVRPLGLLLATLGGGLSLPVQALPPAPAKPTREDDKSAAKAHAKQYRKERRGERRGRKAGERAPAGRGAGAGKAGTRPVPKKRGPTKGKGSPGTKR